MEVEIPGAVDTLEASVITGDLYQGIKLKDGSKKDTAMIAEFVPSKKQFVIRHFPRTDTLWLKDTIRLRPTDIILRGSDDSERLIWIISFALTTIFIIIYKKYLNVRIIKK